MLSFHRHYKFTQPRRVAIAATTSFLVLGATGAALAADLGGSIKDAPVYASTPRLSNWTGFYVGANLGGAWPRDHMSYSQAGGVGAFTARTEGGVVTGGAQIGYNWQAGSLVVGIEADLSALDTSVDATVFPFGNATDAVTLSRKANWLGTVRPRIGYAAGDWLLYATGGLAFGNVEHTLLESRITVPGQSRQFSESETRVGWTIGAGVEWKLNRNWSIGAEYLHVDLGSTTLNTGASVAGGLAFSDSNARFEDKTDIVRAKLNYKF